MVKNHVSFEIHMVDVPCAHMLAPLRLETAGRARGAFRAGAERQKGEGRLAFVALAAKPSHAKLLVHSICRVSRGAQRRQMGRCVGHLAERFFGLPHTASPGWCADRNIDRWVSPPDTL